MRCGLFVRIVGSTKNGNIGCRWDFSTRNRPGTDPYRGNLSILAADYSIFVLIFPSSRHRKKVCTSQSKIQDGRYTWEHWLMLKKERKVLIPVLRVLFILDEVWDLWNSLLPPVHHVLRIDICRSIFTALLLTGFALRKNEFVYIQALSQDGWGCKKVSWRWRFRSNCGAVQPHFSSPLSSLTFSVFTSTFAINDHQRSGVVYQ